ncbi:MAG: helix-turn-helix transcriptional regulator [Tepidisphaeraceae bacterium]|jgi:predicted XRE-type DNA-binding protein
MADGALRPVVWIGSSPDDLRRLSDAVQDEIGCAVGWPSRNHIIGSINMSINSAKRKRLATDNARVRVGGVNVFKVLGRPDADEAFAKVELAYKIHTLIRQRGLSQTQAAGLLATDRARVSNLMRGRLREFSIDRLFHFLNRLGQDIDVTIRPKRRSQAQVHILAKAG